MADLSNNNLEYLTIDSIQWSTGHVRPRMAVEEKRAKHRMHQRDFILRQRQRFEQLQRDVRRYSLQLKLMELTREVAALVAENEAMQDQLKSQDTRVTAEYERMSFKVTCDDSMNGVEDLATEEDDQDTMPDLLDMLPDVNFFNMESPVGVDSVACYDDAQVEQLVWPSSPSCVANSPELLG